MVAPPSPHEVARAGAIGISDATPEGVACVTALVGDNLSHRLAATRAFRSLIRRHACEGIGVPDVVAQVGVSRRLLEKRVREATGGSVLDMIQKVRLENVCRLLVNTTLPISDITTNSGYEATSNLSHLFRRTYGMSMRDYRARHAAGEQGPGART